MENFKIEKFIDRPDFYRSSDEKMCYDLLDELSISYERYVYDHYPVDDKEMMILDSYIEVKAIKNLIYRTQNKSDFYLIIMPKTVIFDKKRFKEAMHLKKIAMATLDDLKIIHAQKGNVGIFDLAYDIDHRFSVYVHENVLSEPYFRFHPFYDDTLIKIKSTDLLKILERLGYSIKTFH